MASQPGRLPIPTHRHGVRLLLRCILCYPHFIQLAAMDHRGYILGMCLHSCCASAADVRHDQKNVYSVFRYDPPSVGFAALSETALAMNGVNAVIPSATIGASIAAVTNAASMTQRTCTALLLIPAFLSFLAFS